MTFRHAWILALAASSLGAQEARVEPSVEAYDLGTFAASGRAPEDLLDLVRTCIDPPFSSDGGEWARLERGLIEVSGRPVHHAWVAAFLDLQSRSIAAEDRFLVEATVLSGVPADLLERFALAEGTFVREDPAEVERFLAAVRESGTAAVLARPRVVVVPCQRAKIEISTTVAVLRDYRVHERVEPTGARIVDPVVEEIAEGTTLACLAAALGDGTAVLAALERRDLVRPMATRLTEHGQVGLPEVSRIELECDVVLARGATAIVVGPSARGGATVVLISASKG